MHSNQDGSDSPHGEDRSLWTNGRRFAGKFSSNGCYNPSSKIRSDQEEQNQPPKLDRGWEYFENFILPRCLVKVEERKINIDSAAEESSLSRGRFTRASVGKQNKKTMLYPVGETPIYDMADFGLGVGYYFTTLRFLALVSLIAGCLSIPNMLYFDSKDYIGDRRPGAPDIVLQDLTESWNSLKGWGLRGSAVCKISRWEICPTCKPSDWDTFPTTGDRLGLGILNGAESPALDSSDWWDTCLPLNSSDRLETGICANEPKLSAEFFIKVNGCNVNTWFGMYSLATLVFVTSSLLYWVFSLNKRIKIYDEATFHTANYSIEVTNPPDVEDSLSPIAWKEWCEAAFDVEVAACTITLDNRPLITALIRRRELILQLQEHIPLTANFGEEDLDSFASKCASVPRWKQIMLGRKNPDGIIASIKTQSNIIQELSRRRYRAMRVFITLQTEEQQQSIMNTFTIPLLCRCCSMPQKYLFQDAKLQIIKPAEPTEIRWNDLNVAGSLRFIKIFLTFLAASIIILGSGIAIAFARSIGPAYSSIAIEAFSYVTPTIVRVIDAFELHRDESSASASKYLKITTFRWILSAIVIAFITPFTDTLQEGSYLIDSIFTLFLIGFIAAPFFQLTDLSGNFRRHILAPRKTSQEEMNLCFKNSARVYDIGARYTNVTRILFLTLFYSTIFPAGYFFAFAIFSSAYWLDKFCLLRKWRQGPMIGTAVPKMSNLFLLFCIILYAVMASYTYSHFPFDNACVANAKVSDDHVGSWNVTLKTAQSIQVNITESGTVYEFCDQNLFKKLVFPPIPSLLLKESPSWMNESQKAFSHIFAWIMIGIILFVGGTIIMWLFSQFLYAVFCKSFTPDSSYSGMRFIDAPERNMYVPQVSMIGTSFPLLLCNIDNIDPTLISWAPLYTSYDDQNLIFDVGKVANHVHETRAKNKAAEKQREEEPKEDDKGGRDSPSPTEIFSELIYEQGMQILNVFAQKFKNLSSESENESETREEAKTNFVDHPQSNTQVEGQVPDLAQAGGNASDLAPVFAIVKSWASKPYDYRDNPTDSGHHLEGHPEDHSQDSSQHSDKMRTPRKATENQNEEESTEDDESSSGSPGPTAVFSKLVYEQAAQILKASRI